MEVLTKESKNMESKHREIASSSRFPLRISSSCSLPPDNLIIRDNRDWIADINVSQVVNPIPAFTIGPCQIRCKKRELKSAYPSSFRFRKLKLSFKARRKENVERPNFSDDTSRDNNIANKIISLDEILKAVSLNDDDLVGKNEGSRSFSGSSDFSNVHNDKKCKSFNKNLKSDKNHKTGNDTLEKEYKQKKRKLHNSKKGKKYKNIQTPVRRKLSTKRQPKKTDGMENERANHHQQIENNLKIINMMKIHGSYIENNVKPNGNSILPIIHYSAPSVKKESKNSPINLRRAMFIKSYNNQTSGTHDAPRCIKIYTSEKQSQSIMGIPAAPPGTPGPDTQTNLEFVPSLSDIKSKRLIASRLTEIASKQSKKEQKERKVHEEKMQQIERRKQKEMLAKIKERQRAEIYALNKILTELENAAYESSMKNEAMPI